MRNDADFAIGAKEYHRSMATAGGEPTEDARTRSVPVTITRQAPATAVVTTTMKRAWISEEPLVTTKTPALILREAPPHRRRNQRHRHLPSGKSKRPSPNRRCGQRIKRANRRVTSLRRIVIDSRLDSPGAVGSMHMGGPPARAAKRS